MLWNCDHCGRPYEEKRLVITWAWPPKINLQPETRPQIISVWTTDQQHGSMVRIIYEFCSPSCARFWNENQVAIGTAREAIRSEFSQLYFQGQLRNL